MMYLNELRKSLPVNCLYSKGRVGCGGTTIALENNEPYVICVPFTALVDNKVAQYPNNRRKDPILGIKGGSTIYDVKRYIKECNKNNVVPKIMVTYDSLYKVTEVIDTKEFNLLVDEYHLLFNQYSFRSEAVKRVLSEYKLYKNYCFMTATPLDNEFVLEELRELPLITQEWPSKALKIKVNAINCPNFIDSVTSLINSFLSGINEGNAYLFVNSVDLIKKLVKKVKLTEDNCRVIYSKNNKTNVGISNSSVNDLPKKINFLTSTVFEGADIYDKDGKIFILSDSSKPNTLLDISTSIQQIAGRIRNSKYIGEITHLYNTTIFPDITYEEYKKIVEENIIIDKKAVEEFNNLSEVTRSRFKMEDCGYKYFANYKCNYDANRSRIDLFNFKVLKGEYSANIGLEYEKNGFEVSSYTNIVSKTQLDTDNKQTFKDFVLDLRSHKDDITFQLQLEDACLQYYFIKDAINLLGFERIATLKYVQKDIKDELLRISDKSISNKLIILLRKKIQNGLFYSSSELKKIIQECYNTLQINKTAKGGDISNWFNVTACNKRINGNLNKGFTIINMR